MAHYAFLNEENIVVEVIVGKDETDSDIDWEQHYGELRNLVCKRTSYNAFAGTHRINDGPGFRKNFAGIGYTYSYELDAFIPPKPYPSWLLDEECCVWYAPVPRPADANLGVLSKQYTWDETSVSWVPITSE